MTKKKPTLFNYPPHSEELRRATGLNYGCFKSATITKSIDEPSANDILLCLKETDKFVVKTSIRFLENLLKNIIAKNPVRHKDHNLLLKKINANEINYIQNLIDKDGICEEIGVEIKSTTSFLQKLNNIFKAPVVKTEPSILNKQIWLLHSLKRNLLNHSAFFIWDKELQKYATEIDYYEIINRKAPAVGNDKDYIFYKGEEITSYTTVVY